MTFEYSQNEKDAYSNKNSLDCLQFVDHYTVSVVTIKYLGYFNFVNLYYKIKLYFYKVKVIGYYYHT